MKPDDLFDAITDIRDDQIEYANPRRSRRRYAVPIAACLALALIALPFLWARPLETRPLYTGTAQLAAASYPQAIGDQPEAAADGPYSDAAEPMPVEGGGGYAVPERFWLQSAETLLTADHEQNLVFSPVSLYTILGMSAELCEGEAQKEILDLLQSPGIEDLRDSVQRVWCASFSQEDSSTCLLANSVWLSNSVDYKQPVLDILAENYFADSFRGDMGSPEYDRLHLDWLSEKTGGYLDGMLPELETDPSVLMYLDSTIYFKGRWLDEFDPADNTEGAFHSAYMDQPCTFMRKTSEGFCYRGERFSAVTLHMFGAIEMLFVLPDEGFTTNELLADGEYKRFIATYLDSPGYWEKGVRAYINMSIPKFDVTSDMDMTLGLRKMGINGIFESGSGSFSPITDQDFSFTSVMNTCRIAVDEEGCEGASVKLALGSGATPPPEEEIDFTLDRPFLFTVIRGSGLPIYMGVVNSMAQ